jgi:hypothetical protein
MPKLKTHQFKLAGHVVTERPILFSTVMVKANLEGRKTQTRRTKGLDDFINEPVLNIGKVNGKEFKCGLVRRPDEYILIRPCYGQPGDLLWVRETFCRQNGKIKFKTDVNHGMDRYYNWKPSIHLPKSDARIWMMVEEVRVERLQDISEEDAIAEGVEMVFRNSLYKDYNGSGLMFYTAARSFMSLWESINGPTSWDQNPYVWVIKYRVISKTGRPSDKTIFHHLVGVLDGETNYATI